MGISYKLIILDRDGVINEESAEFIKSPNEWRAIPGSLEAIALLTVKGFKVVVATNQSGLARGLFDQEQLECIHAKMQQEINSAGGKLAGIYYCPHHPNDNCQCRKPKPGLFLQIMQDFKVTAKEILAIGDSYRDFETAKAIGCDFFLVRTGNGDACEKLQTELPAKNIYPDLLSIAIKLAGDNTN